MSDNAFDGVVALNDAGIRESESQAKIAQMMAQAALIWQQVEHASLDNLGRFLQIKWDAQAHENLHRLVVKAQRRAFELQEQSKKLRSKIQWMNRLMHGAETSIEGIRQGWIAFYAIRNAVPGKVIIDAYKSVEVKDEMYLTPSWAHPWHGDGAVTHPYVGHKDPSQLFAWAARYNYYPVFSDCAWEYLVELMLKIDEGAENLAAKKDAEVQDAEAKALELSKIDWDRLKQESASGRPQPPGSDTV